MDGSSDRSQDPSPFAWLMAGAVAAVGLGGVLAARRRRRAEQDLWAAAESGPGPTRGAPRAQHGAPDPGEDEVAGHPS